MRESGAPGVRAGICALIIDRAGKLVFLRLVQPLDESKAATTGTAQREGQREQSTHVLAAQISRTEEGALAVATVKAPGPVNRSRLPSSLCVIIPRTSRGLKPGIDPLCVLSHLIPEDDGKGVVNRLEKSGRSSCGFGDA